MSSGETLRQRKVTEPETEKEKDANEQQEEEEKQKPVYSSSGILSFDFFFLLIATIIIVFVIYRYDLLADHKPKVMSKEQLAEFNGEAGAPLYVAILGEVYDVTKGEKYYAKEKGYYCFVGRDATRAYVTGEFVKDLTDDVEDFTAEKHGGLVEWRQFYRDHKEYSLIGRVTGRFYDTKGNPTDALKKVEEGALQAEEIKKQLEEAKKLHPNCNSRWAQGKGGEVWCKDGYPRLVVEYFPGAEPKKRCACFLETEHSSQKQLYENCNPDATLCKIPPKDDDKKKKS